MKARCSHKRQWSQTISMYLFVQIQKQIWSLHKNKNKKKTHPNLQPMVLYSCFTYLYINYRMQTQQQHNLHSTSDPIKFHFSTPPVFSTPVFWNNTTLQYFKVVLDFVRISSKAVEQVVVFHKVPLSNVHWEQNFRKWLPTDIVIQYSQLLHL